MAPRNPVIKRARGLSPVWIIPFVALILGAWLSVRSMQERGEEIEIIFDSASGIEVGKTKIRYKDVPVGRVTRIRLNDDLSKVRVTASLDRQVSQFLSKHSQFWLVSPRISASGVSNLGTLISGVYIMMDPGKQEGSKRVFKGLTEPPAVQSDDKGTQFILTAETLGSLDIGSPVYYKQIKVGEVTSYRLNPSGNKVDVRIFINAPHDKLVLTQSRFWNVSGLNVKVGAEGIKASMASVAALISGGITFENAVTFEEPRLAESEHVFYLFSDRDSVMEERYSLKYFYRLKFSHSVRGLSVGAPVEFRGLKVGAVEDVVLDVAANEPESLHVYISLEPERLDHLSKPTREEFDAEVQQLVERGLRAQLKTASFITGSRYIDLLFPRDENPGEFVAGAQFSEIPTLDHASDQLDQQVADLITNINRIPLAALGENLSASLESLSNLLRDFDEAGTAGKIDKTLENVSVASEGFEATLTTLNDSLRQLSRRLQDLETLTAPDSATQYELHETLNAVKRAADSFHMLSETLKQQPDALIFGREKND